MPDYRAIAQRALQMYSNPMNMSLLNVAGGVRGMFDQRVMSRRKKKNTGVRVAFPEASKFERMFGVNNPYVRGYSPVLAGRTQGGMG